MTHDKVCSLQSVMQRVGRGSEDVETCWNEIESFSSRSSSEGTGLRLGGVMLVGRERGTGGTAAPAFNAADFSAAWSKVRGARHRGHRRVVPPALWPL